MKGAIFFMWKKVVSCAAAGFLLASAPLPSALGGNAREAHAAANFNDVSSSFWASKEINFLHSKGIIEGYDNGSFLPNNKVTRAQAAKMILSALGEKEPTVSSDVFSDVKKDHWAAGWISLAKQKGIISGYEDGTFKPEETLTRAQMSKLLVRTFEQEYDLSVKDDTVEPFSDVWINQEFRPYVSKLYQHGITTGTDSSHYSPYNSVNRAQFSVFLSRTIEPSYRISSAESGDSSTTPPATTSTYGIVKTDSLNMRSGPSTSSRAVASLKRGTKVDYLGDQQGYWVKVRYNGQTGYVHKLYLKLKNEQGSPVANRVIVLDAGHGGTDPGASGNGVVEKELVLDVAQRVQTKLEAAGATVIMTRTDAATYPELKDRTDLAQSKYADMFVSVHANSAPSAPSANGSEVYYDTSQNVNGSESSILAKEIQEQFVSLVGMNDRGTKDNDFYVVRNTDMPSVLVELGFLTNSEDAAKFKSDYYRNLFAEAIYLGIKNYYNL